MTTDEHAAMNRLIRGEPAEEKPEPKDDSDRTRTNEEIEREFDPAEQMNQAIRAAAGKLAPEPESDEDEDKEAPPPSSWDGGARPTATSMDPNEVMNEWLRASRTR
ncbi:MAG: hypothetical protein M3P01_04155 [Actinomycetota bacterium]|nr:hypothetical protein [Actinomycetota bacterium]